MKLVVYHPSDDLCLYDRAWVKSQEYQDRLCKRCGRFNAAPMIMGLGTEPRSHYAFAILGRNVVEIISCDLYAKLEQCGAIASSRSIHCVPISIGGRRVEHRALIRVAFDDNAVVRGSSQAVFSFCPACGGREYSVVGDDVMVANEQTMQTTPILFAANGGLVVDRDGLPLLKEVIEILRASKPPVRSRRIRLASEPEDGLPRFLSTVDDLSYAMMDMSEYRKHADANDPALPR